MQAGALSSMAYAVDNSDAALQVLSKDGNLVTSDGKALLLGLPALASTAAAADGLSSIIAVRSATGTASLFDTAVGKVRLIKRYDATWLPLHLLPCFCASWDRLLVGECIMPLSA